LTGKQISKFLGIPQNPCLKYTKVLKHGCLKIADFDDDDVDCPMFLMSAFYLSISWPPQFSTRDRHAVLPPGRPPPNLGRKNIPTGHGDYGSDGCIEKCLVPHCRNIHPVIKKKAGV